MKKGTHKELLAQGGFLCIPL